MEKTTEREAAASAGEGAPRAREAPQERFDIKSHVAQTLIEAMEKGETPWQKPWNAVSLRPMNPTSNNGYRGVNRVLLALARNNEGRIYGDNRWVTYQQAQAKGWQVRGGEKGTMIVKVVEIDPTRERERHGAGGGGAGARGAGGQNRREGSGSQGDREERRKPIALRRYFVFNAEQVDGMPAIERQDDLEFDPIERAEAVIEALKEKTGLKVIHGGNQACYVAAQDEVRLPPKKRFKSAYDLYSVALHECGHSSMAPHRLNRTEAYAKRWGDEAYALEELTVEISAAILCAELGISGQVSAAQREKHLANHAGYLQSWIKVVSKDPLAIFTAAKAAERVSEYLWGLERQATAMQEHAEWVAEYDAAPGAGRAR